jgi:hypothetical protein
MYISRRLPDCGLYGTGVWKRKSLRFARIAVEKVILGFQGVFKRDPVNPHKYFPLNSLTIHVELPALLYTYLLSCG